MQCTILRQATLKPHIVSNGSTLFCIYANEASIVQHFFVPGKKIHSFPEGLVPVGISYQDKNT